MIMLPRTDDLEDCADTRMNIIDEISFANVDVLTKISANLKMFTECQEFQYGRIPICFLCDFCQLEPIQGKCIYTNLCGLSWHQALNCMVELKARIVSVIVRILSAS
jgi:hypothetical protein